MRKADLIKQRFVTRLKSKYGSLDLRKPDACPICGKRFIGHHYNATTKKNVFKHSYLNKNKITVTTYCEKSCA